MIKRDLTFVEMKKPGACADRLVPATINALLYRINVAEAKLGVSRSTIYRLVKEGQLELVKIGKRSSGITTVSIHAMIERNKACH